MVLVSIHPFAVRKILFLAVALLGLSSAFCFADPVFMTNRYALSHDPVLGAQSTEAPVRNPDGPSPNGRSCEPSSLDRRDDIRSTATLRLCDTTSREKHPGFSGKAAALAATPVCWRFKVDPSFAIAGFEEHTR